MKALILSLIFVSTSSAFALSNQDLCYSAGEIAQQIVSIRPTTQKVVSVEFKGDLTGIQQLDGIYSIEFSDGSSAELRLNQRCAVLDFHLK